MTQLRWGGGPFSDKRFGFQEVISHDSVVEPEHCGGPLIDLRGNLVGINIARSMRVATFAIPVQDVRNFILRVRPNADLRYLASGTIATNLSR
jgi:serine protease Do